MLKILIALAAIISGCVFGSISSFSEKDIKDAPNVVYNSSFELGDSENNTLPDGWMILNELSNTISWDDQTAHTGEKSLKISHAKTKVNIISDSFVIDPETVYYTQGVVKTNYSSNHPVMVQFITFDAKGKKMNSFSKKYYPGTDWTSIKLTSGFFKSSSRFARIVVSFPAKSDKVFWLDDLESYSVYRMQK